MGNRIKYDGIEKRYKYYDRYYNEIRDGDYVQFFTYGIKYPVIAVLDELGNIHMAIDTYDNYMSESEYFIPTERELEICEIVEC